MATVDADADAFSDIAVTPGQQYWYRVRAYNDAGKSPYSSVATATTPLLLLSKKYKFYTR